jgi:asparagine N-glycosylation enzyme membrane subunit Stt3
LAAWNAQNVTGSPPFWELVIAYSPILLVALPGAYFAARASEKRVRVLLVWAGLGLLLLYFPWSLQRRFISGYLIPLAGLAAIGLDQLFSRKRIFGIAALILIIILIIPTNLMILMGGTQAINVKEEKVYLTQDEYQGLMWLENNTANEAVVLASPEMGLFIPAYTGRRVHYGHPFETASAQRMEELVLNFFTGADPGSDEKAILDADYLFYGKRERSLGEINLNAGYELVFEAGDLRVYRIE